MYKPMMVIVLLGVSFTVMAAKKDAPTPPYKTWDYYRLDNKNYKQAKDWDLANTACKSVPLQNYDKCLKEEYERLKEKK